MTAGILGMGIISPLGSDAAVVLAAIERGEKAPLSMVRHPVTGREHPAFLISSAATQHLACEPRLRRASSISLLAAAAGKAALGTHTDTGSLALVYGVSSGGVQYTRRFYDQVVTDGALAASPLLFPETVYNAPASHLAAMLCIHGATYTLVGDTTVGLQALHFGIQLLAMQQASHVLVVAAEEIDWILLQGHRDWRLSASPHGRGALLAEGAAALLLSKSSDLTVHCSPAISHTRRTEATTALRSALAPLGAAPLIVDGVNGSWVDAHYTAALAALPAAERLHPKHYLGEAIGAGALQQLVIAAAAMHHRGHRRALVASLGWNQQAAAAALSQ